MSVIFAIDCETSGMKFGALDPSEGYQSISWGIVASNTETFKAIDSLYVEIKWDGVSGWSSKAESVHGLSKEHLEQNGMTKEEAAVKIVEFFMKHDPELKHLLFLGHNVRAFDIPFMRRLLDDVDLKLDIAHRSLDTLSLSMGTVMAQSSDELFETLGIKRKEPHNALSDALAALAVYRKIRSIWNSCIPTEV